MYRGRGGYWGYNKSYKRLSDINKQNNEMGYVAPRISKSDLLTKEQIEEKLKYYERVDDDKVKYIKTGTYLRYFITDRDGKKRFRNGGILYRKFPEFFVMMSNNVTWTVSIEGTSFWKKLKPEELLTECEEDVENKDDEIEKLKREIRKLKKKKELNKM